MFQEVEKIATFCKEFFSENKTVWKDSFLEWEVPKKIKGDLTINVFSFQKENDFLEKKKKLFAKLEKNFKECQFSLAGKAFINITFPNSWYKIFFQEIKKNNSPKKTKKK